MNSFNYPILLSLLMLFASCSGGGVRNNVIDSHILHIEQITAETDIYEFLNGVEDFNSSVYDARLLRFNNIPVARLSFDRDRNAKLKEIVITLIRDTELKDSEAIKDILTGKMGAPETNSYDSLSFYWREGDVHYDLDITNGNYYDRSSLTIKFRQGAYE